MKRWLPVILALGISLGVIVAYLVAGGATYKPLAVADPCEPRPPEVLAERGVFEGILLSGLDGAACELGVSREELATALADDAALDDFAAAHGIDREGIEDAVRAGLVRAVDDAEAQGRLSTPIASIARAAAENAPIGLVIDLFEQLPGDPSLADVISAAGDVGITIGDIGDVAIPEIQGFLDGLGGGLPGLGDLPDVGGLEEQLDQAPGDLEGLLPDGIDAEGLQDLSDQLDQLVP
jgi:hypothetical protein